MDGDSDSDSDSDNEVLTSGNRKGLEVFGRYRKSD